MQNKGIALCKDTGRLIGCQAPNTRSQWFKGWRIVSIQQMQITELQVSLILINWHMLDGTSYLLKNWVYVYKCHLKHLRIVTAFYNKVSMLITPEHVHCSWRLHFLHQYLIQVSDLNVSVMLALHSLLLQIKPSTSGKPRLK